MKGVLTSISYKNVGKTDSYVHLYVRSEDKRREHYSFKAEPYFYIRQRDLKGIESVIGNRLLTRIKGFSIGEEKDYLTGEPLARIHIIQPGDCPPIRNLLHNNGIKTWEADIPYVNRYLIDSGIKFAVEYDNNVLKPIDDFYVKPRYWIIDIEALVLSEEQKIEVSSYEPIICIGIYDSYDKKYSILYVGEDVVTKEKNATYIPFKSERYMLEYFLSLMEDKDPDIIMGFNIKDYDLQKIMWRCRHMDLDPGRMSPLGVLSVGRKDKFKIQGRDIIDIYEVSRFLMGKELRRHSLDYVNRILGHGKGKMELEGSYNEVWATDKFKILRYNKRDLDCVLEIELEQDLVTYLDEIRKLIGVTYDDILYKTTVFDVYIMRLLEGKYILPTKTHGSSEGSGFVGAYVEEPIPGVYHNVLVIDFDSLYPNIFITFNIGQESLVDVIDQAEACSSHMLTAIAESQSDIIIQGIHNTKDYVYERDKDGNIRYVNNLPVYEYTKNGNPKTVVKQREVKYYIDSTKRSIIVEILKELMKRRAETKRLIREAKTQSEIDIYTKQDAAFKSVVNCFTGDHYVMTPTGFINIKDMKVGDMVYTLNKDTMEVETKPVTHLHRYLYEDELIGIKQENLDFVVTPNHNFLVQLRDGKINGRNRNNISYDHMKVQDIMGYSRVHLAPKVKFPGLKIEDIIDLTKYNTRSINLKIEGNAFKEDIRQSKWFPRYFDINDMLELIAWYIAKGSAYVSKRKEHDNGNVRGVTHRITITQVDKESQRSIESLLKRMNIPYYFDNRKGFSFCNTLLYNFLVDNFGRDSRTKKIGSIVSSLDESYLTPFVDTLMLSNGRANEYEYRTASIELAESLTFVALKCGYNATYSRPDDCYTVSIKKHRGVNPCIKKGHYYRTKSEDGYVYCITARDNHTIMAGRNNVYHWTGQSAYGVMGRPGFRLFKPGVGEACTNMARNLLKFAIDKARDMGYDVIYGDSVMRDTPILSRKNGIMSYVPIEDFSSASNTNTRTHYSIDDIEVLDENGWTKAKHVFKHRVNKNVYGILTGRGYVECTEDHSLMIGGKEVKPSSLSVGDRIDIVEYRSLGNHAIDGDIAWLIGFYLADGSSSVHHGKHGIKYSWYIAQSKHIDALLRAQEILKSKLGFDTKIIDTNCPVGMKRLVPVSNSKELTLLFQHWCHSKENHKLIPSFVLNSNKKRELLEGLWIGDGYNSKTETSICLTDKCLIAGITHILNDIGQEYTLSIRDDKPDVLRIRYVEHGKTPPDEITRIRVFTTHDYVYDIETHSHHFSGGIGNVLLHNTDSIFVALGEDFEGDLVKEGLHIADEINKAIAEMIEKDYPTITDNSIKMDMETVFAALAIWSKKNYLGKVIWSKGQYRTTYMWKGSAAVRTDVSDIVMDMYNVLGKSLVDGKDSKYRRDYLKNLKKRLMNKELSIYEVGSPKQLKKSLKEYKTPVAHVRASIYSNENLGTRYRRGDKPMWAYVISPDSYPETDVIAFTKDTKIPSGFEPDREVIVKRQLQPTIDRFLSLVNESYKIPIEPFSIPDEGKLTHFFGGNHKH